MTTLGGGRTGENETLRTPAERPDGDCPICMENLKKLKRLVLRLPCGHVFCRKCIVAHARTKLADVSEVGCPDPACTNTLHLSGLIGKKLIQAAAAVPVNACPVNRCRGKMVDGYCDKCGAAKCNACGEAEHEGKECDPAIQSNYQAVKRESKPCPQCKTPIYKDGGCNHVKCARCKTDFNYETLTLWKDYRDGLPIPQVRPGPILPVLDRQWREQRRNVTARRRPVARTERDNAGVQQMRQQIQQLQTLDQILAYVAQFQVADADLEFVIAMISSVVDRNE